MSDPRAEDGVVIEDEVARAGEFREGERLSELTNYPFRERMVGDPEMEDLPAPVINDEEAI